MNTFPVFSLVKNYPAPSGGNTIKWLMDPDFLNTVDQSEFAGFHVELGIPGSAWTRLTADALTNTNTYTDTVKRLFGMLDNNAYRVVAVFVHPGDGSEEDTVTEYTSQPVDVFGDCPKQDWTIARSMIYQQYYKMSRVSGSRFFWIPRITYGTPCTRCSNPDSQQPLSGRCTECYGTGLTGGYYGAHALLTESVKPIDTSRQYSDQGAPTAIGRLVVDLPAYPEINVKDVLVDAVKGDRYEVDKQNVIGYYRQIPIRQRLELLLLPHSAIEQDIPLQTAATGWTTGISMFARIL